MPYRIFLCAVLFFVVSLPVTALVAGPDEPSFWIEALHEPDKAVLDPAGIEALNRAITAGIDQMADVASFPDSVPGGQLSGWLAYEPVPPVPKEPRFSGEGEPLEKGFFEALRSNMALGAIAVVNPVGFGVVVERADIRAFPSGREVIKRPGGFDTFQYSSIAPGEPAALLHRSADGEWGFFQTRFVRGWIRLDKVAFGARGGIPPDRSGFMVVTGSREAVFADTDLKEPVMALPMGSVLHTAAQDATGRAVPVLLPARDARGGLSWRTGYVDRQSDVREGFLPYTRRNVITQAFKMLGEEYGWGGRDGLRDCSAFVKDIFASMGVNLPRNSRQQGASGVVKLSREGGQPHGIAPALEGAAPGTTLLTLDGHIMLYLGEASSKPYVIHQIWGYMDAGELKEVKKVSVTGLDLGAGSEAGAFKERIRSVSEVTLSPSLPAENPAQDF